MSASRTIVQVVITAIAVFALGVAPRAAKNPVFEFQPASLPSPAAEELPAVGSFANLKALMSEAVERGLSLPRQVRGARLMFDSTLELSAGSAQPQLMRGMKKGKILSGAPNALGARTDFSTTNIQVLGVDEADIVKTDGEFIYQISEERLVVTRALPAADMRVVATLDFNDNPDSKFSPRELYVDDARLVVVGASFYARDGDEFQGRNTPTVEARIYSLRNGKPQLTREVEIEGNYISSRRIGSALYLVANKYIDAYLFQVLPEIESGMIEPDIDPAAIAANNRRNRVEMKAQSQPPTFRDTGSSNDLVEPGFDQVRYFPGSDQTNYLTVAGLNLDRPETEMHVATYLGAGEEIYASTENLYVTMARPEKAAEEPVPNEATDSVAAPEAELIAPRHIETAIFKFTLNGGRTTYRGEGAVPGTVLNQFSMDEHDGHFRLATTSDDWATGERNNNLYVLDNALEVIGRLEGLAPGERIYSARFMGPRAYLVTFKRVDPLFVIDLATPAEPKVLGELKIPGYSDYLHPLDENHLIGFGKDTVAQGNFALFQGVKMAVFDVSDVTKPVEKWKTVIGDRGSDSPLLSDHRALLIDVDRRLLAFPVTVIRRDGVTSGGFNESRYWWQGLYVYRLKDDNTLVLRDTITHLSEPASPGDRHDTRRINRALYIDKTLYTVSNDMIKANDLSNLAEIGEILLGSAAK